MSTLDLDSAWDEKYEQTLAIIKWIKPKLGSHPAYAPYIESKAKPQHIAEVIRQYHLVSEMLQQFSEMWVTENCDGPNAPGSQVTSVRSGFNSTQIHF